MKDEYLNTKIYIISGDEDIGTGKTYQIIHGYLHLDRGIVPFNTRFKTLTDVIIYFLPDSIRLKLFKENIIDSLVGWSPEGIQFVEVQEGRTDNE